MPHKALTQNLAGTGIRFPRINADQTTDELTAAQMRAALGLHVVRLSGANITFNLTTTVATVLQLTGLVAGATYWTEIGATMLDAGSTGNAKMQCAQATLGGRFLAYDVQTGAVEGTPEDEYSAFLTTGLGATSISNWTSLNWQWCGWCVADGSGNITLKAAQLASTADDLIFTSKDNVDALGLPGNTYIRAQLFSQP